MRALVPQTSHRTERIRTALSKVRFPTLCRRHERGTQPYGWTPASRDGYGGTVGRGRCALSGGERFARRHKVVVAGWDSPGDASPHRRLGNDEHAFGPFGRIPGGTGKQIAQPPGSWAIPKHPRFSDARTCPSRDRSWLRLTGDAYVSLHDVQQIIDLEFRPSRRCRQRLPSVYPVHSRSKPLQDDAVSVSPAVPHNLRLSGSLIR